MKKIGISIQNGLLAEGIIRMLHENGEFQPFRITSLKKNGVVSNCLLQGADILLAEVSYANGATIEGRLSEAKALRAEKPECKIAFLCDENSSPEIAKAVMTAKKDGIIDVFFYASVTAKYLVAALDAI
jgi:hypothetical protein